MDNGEYPLFQQSELRNCEDKPDHDPPTDPSSHLQDKSCQDEQTVRVDEGFLDIPGPPCLLPAEAKIQDERDDNLSQILGMIGHYLTKNKKKKPNDYKRKGPRKATLRRKIVKGKVACDNAVVMPKVGKQKWKRISIHPYLNFYREFKKSFPKGFSNKYMQEKAVKAWKKMGGLRRLRYYQQAERAKMRGYSD